MKRKPRKNHDRKNIISTTDQIPGYEVVSIVGVVFASASSHGNNTSDEELEGCVSYSAGSSLTRLNEQCRILGGDAVLGTKVNINFIPHGEGPGVVEKTTVIAVSTGTVVKLSPAQETDNQAANDASGKQDGSKKAIQLQATWANLALTAIQQLPDFYDRKIFSIDELREFVIPDVEKQLSIPSKNPRASLMRALRKLVADGHVRKPKNGYYELLD